MYQNQYNSFYENQSQFVSPRHVYEKEQRFKRKIAGLLTVSMLGSAILGFGGGMFAGKLRQSDQPQSTRSEIHTPIQLSTGGGSSFDAVQVAAVSMDSVVEITTESLSRGNRIMGQYISKGAGSGVIITKNGYIVTNNHVVAGANKIAVRTRDGKQYQATIVGVDEKTDLAVVKVGEKNLKAAEYGSSKELAVGQPVLAIGNPLGELGGTVTDGIISALDREVEIENQKMTLLQTNASVNPGNSGGGLFNAEGKLIGVVNAKSSGSGIEGLGFAIPIDTARTVIDQLIKNGYVTGRIDIGMEFLDVDDQSAYFYRLAEPGVYVSAVSRGSYAEQAGFRAGDRIISVGNKKIDTAADIEEELKNKKVGDVIELRIERNSKQSTAKLTLGEEKPNKLSLY